MRAAGPLIGGLITWAISWRASFVFQALVIAVIVWLSRDLRDPLPPNPDRPFDVRGAVLSATGLTALVMGILAADDSTVLMVGLLIVGAVLLAGFVLSNRAKERSGEAPLLSTAVFGSRTANLGLVTQGVQWLMLLGTSFVVAAFLQVVRGYDAIETGLIFTAATAGLLVVGLGLGMMLTPSVNVVQSSFGESLQGEISGLSRSVSNLGSTLGTAIAGTVLVAGLTATPDRAYGLAMAVLAAAGLIGLLAALRVPRTPAP